MVGAPYWKVGITLLWTTPISVVWCTVAEKVSLRAQHYGRESDFEPDTTFPALVQAT